MTALAHLPRGIQAIVEPWEAHLDPTAGKLSLRTIEGDWVADLGDASSEQAKLNAKIAAAAPALLLMLQDHGAGSLVEEILGTEPSVTRKRQLRRVVQ